MQRGRAWPRRKNRIKSTETLAEHWSAGPAKKYAADSQLGLVAVLSSCENGKLVSPEHQSCLALAMARNPSSGFRKIDVDQYGDDVFKEDENAETHSPAIGVDEQEVRRLIQAGKYGDALRNLLTSAPLSSKNPSVKDNAYNLVLQVLLSVKASEIDKVLESLNEDVALIDV